MINDEHQNLPFELVVSAFPSHGFVATVILSGYTSRPSVSAINRNREEAIAKAIEKMDSLLEERRAV